ncbi:hypothetical protein [Pseudoalteromonas undina]|jgi:predicted DNA-binding transcriptional regulator AlpA|uniref:hypothetical protein n=1 Tax=Pseudoalteromonas undina TaxID=43660 RepID=UPI001868D202|nr:hypothetical protein [Pseudoalteromonas undina]
MKFLAKRELKIADEEVFISKLAVQNYFGISSYLIEQLIAQDRLSKPTPLAPKVTGWPLNEVKQISFVSTA